MADSHGFQRTVLIDAPPQQVFEAITDLEQSKHYMPGIKRQTMLTEGPFGKGTKWKETRSFKVLGFIPMRGTSTLECTEFEKDDHYAVVFDDGANWVRYRFKVEPTDGSTRLNMACQCRGTGRYEGNGKVAQRLARMMEKYDGDLLERIKRHVEAQTTVTA